MKRTDKKSVSAIRHQGGVTYFTREIERRVFFILTMVMLILGIICKIGWL